MTKADSFFRRLQSFGRLERYVYTEKSTLAATDHPSTKLLGPMSFSTEEAGTGGIRMNGP